jgi:hypothetical protein
MLTLTPSATTLSSVIGTSGRVDLRLDRPLRHAQGKQRGLERYLDMEATILSFEEAGRPALLVYHLQAIVHIFLHYIAIFARSYSGLKSLRW